MLQRNDDKQKIIDDLKNNRAGNVTKIVLWQGIAISVVTVGPFLLRALFIRELGMEILGLQSVFQTIFNVLSISEMGFSQAMVFFLLRPLAEGDYTKVNGLLASMRKVYHIMGLVIIAVGVCIIPVVGYLVKSDSIAHRDIIIYYIAYLLSGDISYFFFLETVSLLNALQKLDIYYGILIVVNTCEYIAQALVIILLHSYFLYIVLIGLAAVLSGIIRKAVTRRTFPQFRPEGIISKEESKDIKRKSFSVFGHRLDEALLNSLDNVFITFFLGLSAVASYGNYFYVITAVTMFIDVVFSSLLSAIGNALITEEKESNIFRFRCVFWLNAVIVGWATCCMFNLYQGFIYLWVGNHLLGMDMVILFCIYFYISQMRKTVLLFKNAAGMWDQDALKPYISMVIDLVLDIVLIITVGMRGAIISSIACLVLIEIPWETVVLFKKNLNIPILDYIWSLLKYSVINMIVIILSAYVCSSFIFEQGIIAMILRFMVCTIISGVVYLLLFRKSELAGTWIETLKTVRIKR